MIAQWKEDISRILVVVLMLITSAMVYLTSMIMKDTLHLSLKNKASEEAFFNAVII